MYGNSHSTTTLEIPIPLSMWCFIRLYNKEAVIEYLLNKASATSDVASHIRSLKVVCSIIEA